VVVEGDVFRGLLRERVEPVCGGGGGGRVEVGGAGDDGVGEEVGVARGGDGGAEEDAAFDVVEVVGLVVEEGGLDVAVRGDRGDAEEEGAGGVLLGGEGFIEEVEGFGGEDVDRVLACVADGGVAVALEGGVEVAVGVGVEQEVGAVPPGWVGRVVVVDRVRVEQLARVVRVVAGLLQPQGQVGVVEALLDKLGVSAWLPSALSHFFF
jgi:hypothetical protein